MFTSERIPELQGTGELPGSNQKSRPIDLPFVFYFPHFIPPLGEGILRNWLSAKMQFCSAGFSVKVKKNLRAIRGAVNPKFLCNSGICQREFPGVRRTLKVREESLLERPSDPDRVPAWEGRPESQTKISTSDTRNGSRGVTEQPSARHPEKFHKR